MIRHAIIKLATSKLFVTFQVGWQMYTILSNCLTAKDFKRVVNILQEVQKKSIYQNRLYDVHQNNLEQFGRSNVSVSPFLP